MQAVPPGSPLVWPVGPAGDAYTTPARTGKGRGRLGVPAPPKLKLSRFAMLASQSRAKRRLIPEEEEELPFERESEVPREDDTHSYKRQLRLSLVRVELLIQYPQFSGGDQKASLLREMQRVYPWPKLNGLGGEPALFWKDVCEWLVEAHAITRE